jgi:hypothetical protein
MIAGQQPAVLQGGVCTQSPKASHGAMAQEGLEGGAGDEGARRPALTLFDRGRVALDAWMLDGYLHSFNDFPAIEWAEWGEPTPWRGRAWGFRGYRHRGNGLPACVSDTGLQWWVFGQLHNGKDKPARIHASGVVEVWDSGFLVRHVDVFNTSQQAAGGSPQSSMLSACSLRTSGAPSLCGSRNQLARTTTSTAEKGLPTRPGVVGLKTETLSSTQTVSMDNHTAAATCKIDASATPCQSTCTALQNQSGIVQFAATFVLLLLFGLSAVLLVATAAWPAVVSCVDSLFAKNTQQQHWGPVYY